MIMLTVNFQRNGFIAVPQKRASNSNLQYGTNHLNCDSVSFSSAKINLPIDEFQKIIDAAFVKMSQTSTPIRKLAICDRLAIAIRKKENERCSETSIDQDLNHEIKSIPTFLRFFLIDPIRSKEIPFPQDFEIQSRKMFDIVMDTYKTYKFFVEHGLDGKTFKTSEVFGMATRASKEAASAKRITIETEGEHLLNNPSLRTSMANYELYTVFFN